ncbi:hypothetical protein BT96DRAFT_819424, partial [Gymnopus androsaceus JB14]
GGLFNTYLFGVLSCQVYVYYLSFPADATHVKILVYGVFMLDSAATFMSLADQYHWFAVGFGNPLFIHQVYLSIFDTPMLGAFLAAIVQCFYCYRMYTLSKKTWPVCILVMLVCTLYSITTYPI